MRRTVGAVFILVGLLAGVAGLALLPADRGRLEYLVQIVDPRPVEEAGVSAELAALGAIPSIVAEPPARAQPAPRVLLPDLERLIGSADVALGTLPMAEQPQAVAGQSTGIKRGELYLVGLEVTIVGSLQELGPLIDESIVMAGSDELSAALVTGGWDCRAQYLLPAASWEERTALLARLEGDPGLLPVPDARVVSPARKPALSRRARLTVSASLVCCGLLVLGWQMRGLSREHIIGALRRR